VDFFKQFFKEKVGASFKKQLKNVLGFSPNNLSLYKTALTHRSVRENADENNERLEYLGDAVLSALVADYLFMRYPYKEEGFLTEMRSKMVNRQQLNEIALRMGLKKITLYNKSDGSLKISQIFGNTLEALVGAIYLDRADGAAVDVGRLRAGESGRLASAVVAARVFRCVAGGGRIVRAESVH
jgi:ribonuclease-3